MNVGVILQLPRFLKTFNVKIFNFKWQKYKSRFFFLSFLLQKSPSETNVRKFVPCNWCGGSQGSQGTRAVSGEQVSGHCDQGRQGLQGPGTGERGETLTSLTSAHNKKSDPRKWCSTCKSRPQGFQVSMRYRWIFMSQGKVMLEVR